MKIKLLFSFLLFNVYVSANAATPPNATISYNTPFCQSSTSETVTLTGTTGGTFSATPSGLFINPTSGEIDPSQSNAGTYTVTYTIPPGVDPPFAVTTIVTVNAQPNAGNNGSIVVCESSMAATIYLYSLITGEQSGGSWVRTSGSGGYFDANAGTFMYAEGPMLSTFMYTILGNSPCVNDTSIASVFVAPQPNAGLDGAISVCSTNGAIDLYSIIVGEQSGGVWTRTSGVGGTFNAVAGTFLPSADATTSSFTYTITGGAPCLNDSSMVTITIITEESPNFAQIAPLCPGTTPPTLPTVSPNGISGTWSPPVINTQTVGTYAYTFTPDPGLCASSQTLAVTVLPLTVPTFTFATANICAGNAPILPTTSDNGIVGTWSPSTITETGNYMFVPNVNQCATSISLVLVVEPIQTPVITSQDNHDYIYVDGNTVVQPLLLSVSLNPNYTYQWYESGVAIANANQSTYLVNTHKESGLHVYQVRATYDFGGCESYSQDFVVHESPVPAPLGNQDQTFSQGQTLADLVVNGQNIQWYDGLGRNVNANPLPLSTVLVDGVTYYASQTINGHESPDRLPVTVHLNVMGNTTFDRSSVVIFPNPVQDVLFVQSNESVNHIEIYNLIGQKLIDVNTTKVTMQSLSSGVYIVQVSTKAGQKSLRVVKE